MLRFGRRRRWIRSDSQPWFMKSPTSVRLAGFLAECLLQLRIGSSHSAIRSARLGEVAGGAPRAPTSSWRCERSDVLRAIRFVDLGKSAAKLRSEPQNLVTTDVGVAMRFATLPAQRSHLGDGSSNSGHRLLPQLSKRASGVMRPRCSAAWQPQSSASVISEGCC